MQNADRLPPTGGPSTAGAETAYRPLVCPITGSAGRTKLASQNGYDWYVFPASDVAMVDLSNHRHKEDDYQAGIADGYIGAGRRKRSKMRRSLRRARLLRRLAPGPRLLDVGSNVGDFCAAARRMNFAPEGVEISASLCRHARQQYPGITFHNSTLEAFESAGTYDAIYCSEVIEHVLDPRGFAARLHTLLAPGGVLYLTTPDLAEYVAQGQPFRDLGAPDHKTYFGRGNIRPFMEQVGFEAVEILPGFQLKRVNNKLRLGGGIRLTCRKPAMAGNGHALV